MPESPSLKSQSDPKADAGGKNQAFLEVYDELRRIAQAHLKGQPPGHTLQTTALVHEAFLKLHGRSTENRGHFLHLAAEAMRQILVDHARGKRRAKRGGGKIHHQELADVAVLAVNPDSETILALDEAICRLESVSPRSAEVTKLRFFTGLTVDETAAATGMSASTVNRHWRFARAWLFDALRDDSVGPPGTRLCPKTLLFADSTP